LISLISGIEVNFTSVSMSVRSFSAPGLSAQSTQLQTPTLIGCCLLKNFVVSFAFRRRRSVISKEGGLWFVLKTLSTARAFDVQTTFIDRELTGSPKAALQFHLKLQGRRATEPMTITGFSNAAQVL
jgi:hypothetical protein